MTLCVGLTPRKRPNFDGTIEGVCAGEEGHQLPHARSTHLPHAHSTQLSDCVCGRSWGPGSRSPRWRRPTPADAPALNPRPSAPQPSRPTLPALSAATGGVIRGPGRETRLPTARASRSDSQIGRTDGVRGEPVRPETRPHGLATCSRAVRTQAWHCQSWVMHMGMHMSVHTCTALDAFSWSAPLYGAMCHSNTLYVGGTYRWRFGPTPAPDARIHRLYTLWRSQLDGGQRIDRGGPCKITQLKNV